MEVIQLWKKRISIQETQQEEQNLIAATQIIQKAWNAEIKCYENGLKQSALVDDTTRENLDPRIFPYHKACYLLLDMYLCVEGEFPYKVPLYVEEFARRDDDIVLEECYLPNSAYAVWASLAPIYRTETYYWTFLAEMDTLEQQLLREERNNGNKIWISSSAVPLASDFSFLSAWSDELSKETRRWFTCEGFGQDNDTKNEVKNPNMDHEKDFRDRYFRGLPSIGSIPKGLRTKVLLKLLKHSMSELQRDHRLARAVLLALIEYKCLDGKDGAEAFRYFLVTIESEFIHDCDEDCLHRDDQSDDDDSSREERVGHICVDWQKFKHTTSRLLQWGIRDFTEEHALILCSFFRHVFDAAEWTEVEDLRQLIGWNDDDYTMAKETPLDLIRSILDGLSRLNYQYRCRIAQLLKLKYKTEVVNDIVDEDLWAVVRSHVHCTRALVSIGEMVLKSCKATPVTETIGSILVTALTLSSIFPLKDNYWYLEHDIEGTYIGTMEGCDRSLIDVTRYADCIIHASERRDNRIRKFQSHLEIHERHKMEQDEIVSELFLTPLTSVRNVVRGLFLRQLVESNEAGCGYGDFMLWSGGTITPLDPLLFEHNMNYPNKTGYDENRLEDESAHELSVDQIKALYDLSLLMLRRAWTFPWTPASHDSFSTPFKRAIQTMALIAHRHDFPLDLCLKINSYISRDWWPMENANCWRYECQIDQLETYLKNEEDEITPAAVPSLLKCNGCRIAHACSKKHLKEIFHDGHRRLCRCPPMRVPTGADHEFCLWYLAAQSHNTSSTNVNQSSIKTSVNTPEAEHQNDILIGSHDIPVENEHDDNNDDDDDWESVDSEDGANDTPIKVDTVLRYFENKAYKIQRVEEHAFASHYAE